SAARTANASSCRWDSTRRIAGLARRGAPGEFGGFRVGARPHLPGGIAAPTRAARAPVPALRPRASRYSGQDLTVRTNFLRRSDAPRHSSLFRHSERSEESLFHFRAQNRREIPQSAPLHSE